MQRSVRIVCRAVLAVAVAAAVCGPADAQDKRKLAYTELDRVDADFAFQGEYIGQIETGTVALPYRQYVGLQVVALGDGEFAAVEYPGGLPGSGWNGGTRVKLEGETRDGFVWLPGESRSYVVQPLTATAYYSDGRPLGTIEKVNRVSRTLGRRPPDGATVLFDGTDARHFKKGKTTPEGLLMEGTELKPLFRDYFLHIEFRLPYMPHARGQGRANSGVYLQSRYEVQVLDSFGLDGVENECGALYRQRRPDLNMCLPPLAWQTYDIEFTSPRFDSEGKKVADARITVWHNGMPVHDNVEIPQKTGAGAVEAPKLLPTKLQNHGNPVRFRNIWVVDRSRPAATPAPLLVPQARVAPAWSSLREW